MVTYKGYRGRSAIELMALERAQGVLYESGRINPYSKNKPFSAASVATPALRRVTVAAAIPQAPQVREQAIIRSVMQGKTYKGAKPLSVLGLSREPSHPGGRGLPTPRPPPREIRPPPGARALPTPRPPVRTPTRVSQNPLGGALMVFILGALSLASFRRR